MGQEGVGRNVESMTASMAKFSKECIMERGLV
jgi:hypothetical protein